MIKLTQAEEQLMEIIWSRERVFMKEILEAYPEPKPAATTVATLLKRMQEKAAIGFKTFGNSREYFPLIPKNEYFSKQVNSIIRHFFNNSPAQFASFFTTETNLTKKQLEDLKTIVDQQLKKKKK